MTDRWTAEMAAVAQLTDALGRRPDPGVIATVAALRLNGFVTVQSCWGHATRAANGPWVHIAPSPGEDFDTLHTRVHALLDDIPTTRRVSEERRLRGHLVHHHETHLPCVIRIQTTLTFEATHNLRPRSHHDLVSARHQMTALTTYLRRRLDPGRPSGIPLAPPSRSTTECPAEVQRPRTDTVVGGPPRTPNTG